MDKHRLALIVIGMLAVAVVVGGWFIGVQPQLDRMSRAQSQTESIEQLNAVQEVKNAALAADNEKLDEYKGELADYETQIPPARQQQGLINELDAAAEAAGVSIQTLSFEAPSAFMAPENVTVAMPAGGSLVAVPLSLAARGDREQLKAFVANLQNSPRIITVTSSSYSGPDDASLTLTGTTWVLLPAS